MLRRTDLRHSICGLRGHTNGARLASKYSLVKRQCSTLLCLLTLAGCTGPDPSTVRGALDGAAQAVAAEDPLKLYWFIDQRARDALGGIVAARHEAKQLIRDTYPQEEQARALADLGDSAKVDKASELFAHRCGDVCFRTLAGQLGAPTHQQDAAPYVVVRTTRGTELKLFRGRDGRFGLWWNSEALMAERDHASRELKQIEDNAAVYRKRAQLSTPSQP